MMVKAQLQGRFQQPELRQCLRCTRSWLLAKGARGWGLCFGMGAVDHIWRVSGVFSPHGACSKPNLRVGKSDQTPISIPIFFEALSVNANMSFRSEASSYVPKYAEGLKVIVLFQSSNTWTSQSPLQSLAE